MISFPRTGMLAAAAALAFSLASARAADPVPAGTLAPPQSFDTITDTTTRSAAIFTELGKVLTSPRCTNCHPASDRPRQGDQGRPHQPPVTRGPDGQGTASMRCASCHGAGNFAAARMPGHPEWHLAPRSMAWEGRSIAEIREQIKDPARNGQRKVEDLLHHIGQDTLVGWAWAPGYGRTPAPGTQAEAGALVAAWIASGSACPLK